MTKHLFLASLLACTTFFSAQACHRSRASILPIDLTEISRRHSDRGNGIMTLEMYYPKVLVVGDNADTFLQAIRHRADRQADITWAPANAEAAVPAAKEADVVILIVESDQSKLIRTLSAANRQLVVAIVSADTAATPCRNKAAATIRIPSTDTESANTLVNLLFSDTTGR